MLVVLLFSLAAAAAPAHPNGKAHPASLAQTPSPEEIERYYPHLAQRLEIEGAANVTCTVTPEGKGKDCHAVAESPPGLGFGGAAEQLAATFHFKPRTMGETPVEGPWTGRVRFTLADDPPADGTVPDFHDPPKPEVIALAKRYMEVSGYNEQLRTVAEQGRGAVRQECEAASYAYCDQLQAAIDRTADEELSGLEDVIAGRMASVFTEEELKGALAFAESPVGRSLREKTPELNAAFMGLQTKVAREIPAKVLAHYCEAVGCRSLSKSEPGAPAK